jgi:RHS repeat-associated protein
MTEPYAGVQPITLTSYFQYDAEGRLTVSQYPAATSISPSNTTTYTTDHDALGRPSDLYMGTPQQPTWMVLPGTATYNAAGQLTAMSTGAYSETLQYNAHLQLTRLTATPTGGQGIDFTYTYPAGNNGRISQMTDNITSEQVSYTYDQLNRLVQSASSVTGTMPFAYDGFGNLTQQGQTYLSIDPTTNRINSANYQYNANGNVTQTPGSPPPTYTYDVANRLVSNNAIYNPRNQRVFDGTNIYLYTPDGKLAGKYTPVWGQSASNAFIQGGQPNVYFAGKLIQEQGQWVMTDRLGSVRLNGSGGRSSYQPYGAEVTQTSDQRTKFATYYRDSAGLDYAGQRYYGNAMGRFLTPDPGGVNTVDPTDPGSWNRYAYVGGDPINFADRTGRYRNIVGNCGDLVNGQPQDGCDDGGGDDEGGNSASGVCGYWEVGFVETSCPSYGPPSRTSTAAKRRTYFLTVRPGSDCYRVPTNGGPVTRDITYELDFMEEGMTTPMFTNTGVISEHLVGLGSVAGANSPSSGPPGTFPDQQSIAGVGTGNQSGTQSFSAAINGATVGLAIAAFGGTVGDPVASLSIQKYAGYIWINGDIGGKIDANGKLIPGTYTPCK